MNVRIACGGTQFPHSTTDTARENKRKIPLSSSNGR